MTILRAGFSGGHEIATSVFLAALIALFCGFAYQIGRIVTGPPAAPAGTIVEPERIDIALGVACVTAVMAVVSAFYMPAPLLALIHAATQVVWGTT